MSRFGDCCGDFKDALQSPPVSLFRVENNGVLYLSVGFAETPQGIGWFDQAVLFCPFCGTEVQTRAEVQRRAGA